MRKIKLTAAKPLIKVDYLTPLLIKWRDPCGYSGWFNGEKVIRQVGDKEYDIGLDCTSIGYFVTHNQKGIVLAMLTANDADNDVGNLFEIPNGVIVEVYELE